MNDRLNLDEAKVVFSDSREMHRSAFEFGVKLIAEVERLREILEEIYRNNPIESLTKERDAYCRQATMNADNMNNLLKDKGKLETEIAELKKEWQEFVSEKNHNMELENRSLKQKLAASENEIKSVVTEINSIKSERNAVIKAHADLLSECQELKTQLKFLEARLGE